MLLGAQEHVATSYDVILGDEVEEANSLTQSGILLVDEADVPRYVRDDFLDMHIRRDPPGGIVVTHEPPQIYSNLLEGNIVGLQEKIKNIPQIGLPKILPGNSSRV